MTISGISQSYTAAVDVWAAGVVVYMLLSGNEPFGARSDQTSGGGQDLFVQILSIDPSFDGE
eukprot:scaffold372449_cov42-Prasinocladus_malaysianus.AAC.1